MFYACTLRSSRSGGLRETTLPLNTVWPLTCPSFARAAHSDGLTVPPMRRCPVFGVLPGARLVTMVCDASRVKWDFTSPKRVCLTAFRVGLDRLPTSLGSLRATVAGLVRRVKTWARQAVRNASQVNTLAERGAPYVCRGPVGVCYLWCRLLECS